MKRAVVILFLFSISCGYSCSYQVREIEALEEFYVPSSIKDIAWSRAHAYPVKHGIYNFTTMDDYVIYFTVNFETEDGNIIQYKTEVCREWHESGFRYRIAIHDSYVEDSKGRDFNYERERLRVKIEKKREIIDKIAKDIKKYILTGK